MNVLDKIALESEIPNKAQIPLLNHRDDGELRGKKLNRETCKIFSFKTLRELQISHEFMDCQVAIAEDFFWTGMTLIEDGEVNRETFNSMVAGSVWGTPCVVTPDGDAYACYKVLPFDEFPGVYLKDWDMEFLMKELDESEKVVEKFAERVNKQIEKEIEEALKLI